MQEVAAPQQIIHGAARLPRRMTNILGADEPPPSLIPGAVPPLTAIRTTRGVGAPAPTTLGAEPRLTATRIILGVGPRLPTIRGEGRPRIRMNTRGAAPRRTTRLTGPPPITLGAITIAS